MPLGIVKKEEYENELGLPKDQTNIPKTEEVSEIITETPNTPVITGEVLEASIETSSGRGIGNTEVPLSIKKLIGESSIEEGSSAANAIGKFLGLSPSSVSAYANGATSTATYHKPNGELQDFLGKARKRITKRAAGKLFKSLDVIDDERLEKLTALEASTVAKNMSAIIKHMEPEDKRGSNTFNGPIITFYAPHLVQEDKFDVINVNE